MPSGQAGVGAGKRACDDVPESRQHELDGNCDQSGNGPGQRPARALEHRRQHLGEKDRFKFCRRAAELTGGTVLNIEEDFSAPLAALGDRKAMGKVVVTVD